ncbi:hypothetical protein BGZ90_009922 [Linnemannia elongata]|nr:hypothetical protein BGZ90_009922 [Linnemannia elongata]
MIPTIPKGAVDRPRAAYPIHNQGVPVFNTSTSYIFPGGQGPLAPVPAHWGTTPIVLLSNNSSNNNTLCPSPPTPASQNQVATAAAGLLALSHPTTVSTQGWQNVSRFGGHSTPPTAAQLKNKQDLLSTGFSQHVVAQHTGIAFHQSKPPVVFGPQQIPQHLTATHPAQTKQVGGFCSASSQYPTGTFLSPPPLVNQPTNIWAHNAGVFPRATVPPLGGFGMPLNPVVPAQTNQPVLPPAPIPAPAVLAAPLPLPLWPRQQGIRFHGIVILNNIPKSITLYGASDCLDPDELMRQMRVNVADLEEKYKILKEILVGDPDYEEKLKEWKEKIDQQWDEIWSRLFQRHDL